MADDIVERLRDRSVFDNFYLMEEAADEIEQLRRDIKVAIMGDSAELRDAKTENERLRAENGRLRKNIKLMLDIYDDSRATKEAMEDK